MKVSVTMTTYNGAKFVEKQMFSLLKQTHVPDEVIIFDDCSTDNTTSIINEFISTHKLNHWHLFSNEKNIGYIQNFYYAIQASAGDIIFLSDQDDVWEYEKIKTMLQVLAENPTISVLNTAVNLIDENDKDLNVKNKIGFSNSNLLYEKVAKNALVNFDLKHLALRNISPGCSMCFSKEIKEIYLKNPQQNIPHDWFINILGSLQQGTFFYNKALTNYRIHQQNVIGLKTETPLKIESTQDIKVKTATKFYTRTLELKTFLEKENKTENIQFIEKYLQFLKLRLSFVKRFSIVDFMGMLKQCRTYHFVFGSRIIISDLIYLMRLNKFLEFKD